MTEWKLVPVEPTFEMCEAGRAEGRKEFALPEDVYRAMVAASPPPAEKQAAPSGEDNRGWGDPRVQAIYSILCSEEAPPPEQHWEGWAARRIVDALAGQQYEEPKS